LNVEIDNADAIGVDEHYYFDLDDIYPNQIEEFEICGISPIEPNAEAFAEGIIINVEAFSFPDPDGDCFLDDNIVELNIDYFCDITDTTDVCDLAGVDTRIITPNDDGANDAAFFYPWEESRVEIFDSDGYLVRQIDPPEGFDGNDDRGRPLPSGIYVYQLYCRENDETPAISSTIIIER
jgi:hypothetical protein